MVPKAPAIRSSPKSSKKSTTITNRDRVCDGGVCIVKKPLNIGMIGYGFMGRAHSNAYRQANRFFDLQYDPVLKAACGRETSKVKSFADNWGYESTESDWR